MKLGSVRERGHLLNELSMDLWQRLKMVDPDSFDVLIDIGAHVGMYSLMARFFHPKKKILAIEPNRDNYAMLVDNVAELNIDTINVALGNGQPFAECGPAKKSRAQLRYGIADHQNGDTVPSMTLRQIVDRTGCDHHRCFFKVDIQGAEEQWITDHPENKQMLLESAGFYLDLDFNGLEQYQQWLPCINGSHTAVHNAVKKHYNCGYIFAVRI